MKIAVCVKPVPDASHSSGSVEIRINERNTLVRDGLPLIVNPADESAIEAALRLKGGGEVCLVTMGSAAMGKVLKGLLAHGADRAVLVSDPLMAGSDTFATAKTLCAALTYLGGFDLVLCGRRAIDGETGQVPPELAVFLGIPFVTNVTRLKMDGEGALLCDRLLETGVETLRLPLSAIVSLCEYSYPLRPVSLASIRQAREKELTVLDRKALRLGAEECGAAASPTRVRRIKSNVTRLRSGECETDIRAGARKLAKMLLAAGMFAAIGQKRETG
jgi:electron transfer flavoprotein beta subunit